MRFLLSVMLWAVCAASSSAEELVVEQALEPQRNARVAYYDGHLLFMTRNFGSAREPAGPTEPGLFVHSKRYDVWLRIKRVSTVGAKFGRTRSPDPNEQAKLDRLSVGWDYSSLADSPQVELPLTTGGSIALPDRIEFDERSEAYLLRFNSKLEIPVAETTLRVSRAELLKAASAVAQSRKNP